ncbi:hypothetical protein POTOM_031669 [Populus tomentosa]|uniref:Uncharacterized protein n=1 Tax=Populus tomentosa TaxID=118781 RepID=A0A8X8CRX5_POPTO|nr:hypothetical protein POTOM_031669 [Populus tomentosa]
MAMGQERSKPPLHNFDLPFLKWGNQRHLRCMKLPDSNTAADAAVRDNKSESNGGRISVERNRSSSRSPPRKFGNYDIRRFKPPRERFGEVEGGIDEVREKIMLDLKTAANEMKDKILRKEVSDDDSEIEEERYLQSQSQSPLRAVVAAVEEAPAEPEVRPWNLRTRRAAIGGGGNSVLGKVSINNCSPLRNDSAKSPRLRGDKRDRKEKEKEMERAKFSVPLSKKEIEEDFMVMLCQRPARRPKKRPRIVQKQMDALFPGLWLAEVTVDTYKVPELPESGKVKFQSFYSFSLPFPILSQLPNREIRGSNASGGLGARFKSQAFSLLTALACDEIHRCVTLGAGTGTLPDFSTLPLRGWSATKVKLSSFLRFPGRVILRDWDDDGLPRFLHPPMDLMIQNKRFGNLDPLFYGPKSNGITGKNAWATDGVQGQFIDSPIDHEHASVLYGHAFLPFRALVV